MTKIRSACRVNLPPTIMWDIEQNTWTPRALALVQALQMFEDSLCHSCGQSAMHAFEVGNTRAFTVDSDVCLGCNAREGWEANNGDNKTKGLKVYVVNHMGRGEPDGG